jgi:hypothetical protein
MKKLVWSTEKNQQLKDDTNRAICFEDIVTVLETDGFLDDIKHPNQIKYPHQRMFVVLVNGYVYGVPYVENDEEIFLKTAFQSRRLKNAYLGSKADDENT